MAFSGGLILSTTKYIIVFKKRIASRHPLTSSSPLRLTVLSATHRTTPRSARPLSLSCLLTPLAPFRKTTVCFRKPGFLPLRSSCMCSARESLICYGTDAADSNRTSCWKRFGISLLARRGRARSADAAGGGRGGSFAAAQLPDLRRLFSARSRPTLAATILNSMNCSCGPLTRIALSRETVQAGRLASPHWRRSSAASL